MGGDHEVVDHVEEDHAAEARVEADHAAVDRAVPPNLALAARRVEVEDRAEEAAFRACWEARAGEVRGDARHCCSLK